MQIPVMFLAPDSVGNQDGVSIWWHILFSTTALAPVVPILFASLRLGLSKPLQSYVTVPILLAVLIFGGLFTVVNAGFSGAGTVIALIHGSSLTVAVAASVHLLARDPTKGDLKSLAGVAILYPAVVALWSITASVFALGHAHFLANGQNYCFADHAAMRQLQSLMLLRGLSFYTTATGYKSTSRWYYHGLLIIDRDGDKQVYNWSPRRLHFDKIENPTGMIAGIERACTPSENVFKRV